MTEEKKKEIEKRLEELKYKLKVTKGTKCEVYSRVCGYLRPTDSWNKGKKEEFGMRKTFKCTCN